MLLTIVLSCKKDKTNLDLSIVGKWKWAYYSIPYPNSSGGATIVTPTIAGFNETLEFLNNYTWSKYIDNQKTDSGTYNVEYKEEVNPSNTIFKFKQVTYFRNNNYLGEDYYSNYSDSLVLNPSLKGYFISQNVAYAGSIRVFKK